MLGIPGEIVDATEHLLRIADDWQPRKVDLGRANGRYFALSAGFGLDAAVTQGRRPASPRRKHRFGEWYFTWSAVRTFFRHYLVAPAAGRARGRRRRRAATASTRSSRTATRTRTSTSRPLHVAEDSALDSGRPRRRDAPPRDAGRRPDRRLPPVLAAAPRSSTTARSPASRGVGERARAVGRRRAPIPLQLDGDWVGDATEVHVLGRAARADRRRLSAGGAAAPAHGLEQRAALTRSGAGRPTARRRVDTSGGSVRAAQRHAASRALTARVRRQVGLRACAACHERELP